jgi:hypothetical protein
MEGASAIWARKWWRIMHGRIDATDAGWTHKGRIRRLRLVWLRTTHAVFGIGLVVGRRMYNAYWCR